MRIQLKRFHLGPSLDLKQGFRRNPSQPTLGKRRLDSFGGDYIYSSLYRNPL